MRLGQLARKLKVEPSTIVKFLAKNNIIIENAPNVKIEDDNLALTLTQFEVKEATPVIREEEQIIKTVAEIIVENTVTEKAEEPSIDDIQTNLIEETIEASSLEEHPIIV